MLRSQQQACSPTGTFIAGRPECGRNSDWVVAHWWEVGTWSGESCGLKPTNGPMACEGQTRFLVKDGKITEFVVTRTITEWEAAFLEQQKA